MDKRVVIGIGLLVLILACGYVLADRYQESPEEMTASYVGRDSCVDCHQGEAELFHGSDHDLAMDLATDETVLADFDDQTIEHYGIESRMFRDGKRFMINTEGPDGEMQDFEVKYVFGVRPLQQYMVEIERPEDAQPHEIGKVQVLRVSWDTNKKEWFFLRPPDVDEKIQPDDPLHWTGITQNWNASCAACHSTDLKRISVRWPMNIKRRFQKLTLVAKPVMALVVITSSWPIEKVFSGIATTATVWQS